MTRGRYIPTDFMKSGDDYFNLVHNILDLGHILIRIRPIRYAWLVKVMKYWVGII